jgi:hypothetical protein
MAQAVSRWIPTAATRLRVRVRHVGFAVDKVVLGQVFSEYFGFPCQSYSTNFSTIILIRGWHNRPIGGRSAEWTQLDSTPDYSNLSMARQSFVKPWPLFQVFGPMHSR